MSTNHELIGPVPVQIEQYVSKSRPGLWTEHKSTDGLGLFCPEHRCCCAGCVGHGESRFGSEYSPNTGHQVANVYEITILVVGPVTGSP